MDVQGLQNLLDHYGLSPNKTYGQNFLMDEMVLHRMVEFAQVNKNDIVLEVGPGIGNLTRILLEQSKEVIAVEKDTQFLPVLKEYQSLHKNFRFVLGDILEQNLGPLLSDTQSYKVVANIPYYVTGKIIQYFVQADRKPQSLTLLMQKEVAQNLTAGPGKLNLLAISVQLYANVEFLEVVPAHKFYPAPKVDSAVVKIVIPTKPKFEIADQKKLFRLLRACFVGKRKQIHNTLTSNLQLDKEQVLKILSSLKIDPTARPQQLSLKQWLELAEKI